MADMGHQRQVDRFGRFERQFQRPEPEIAGDDAADAHLHPDEAVAIGLDLFDATMHQQHVARGRLADRHPCRKPKMPGKRC